MNKSILDHVKIANKAFPRDKDYVGELGVVGSCPKCGSPIYGRKTLLATDVPEVKFSCVCSERTLFSDTVCTK
jgi:hypothetical protein